MLEPANREAGGVIRLILGFDGGCATCSDLAERISQSVGDRLEVRSLRHPQVEHWREKALGKDAPWAPTLFEVGGAGEVRAWTGVRMAVRLARVLGPASTWRVMQALGEVGASRTEHVASASRTVGGAGVSRGQFLKGMGGAAVAFGVLSGAATPALAARRGLNEEALVQAFSAIEELPDSVVARGDRTVRGWFRQRLEGRFNLVGCAFAILQALASNAIPIFKILKIRRAIKIFGGTRKFVAALHDAYRYGRSRGMSRRAAIRYAAYRAYEITGVDVVEAIVDLFSLSGVANHCF